MMKPAKAILLTEQKNSVYPQALLGRNSMKRLNLAKHFIPYNKEGSSDMNTLEYSTTDNHVPNGDAMADGKSSSKEYRLHLEMDTHSIARLTWLQGALRAASTTEVVRRALDAYKIFDPEFSSVDNFEPSKQAIDTQRLYIRISAEMKEYLDNVKSEEGFTYKDTIRRSLCVLTQLVRDRNNIIASNRTQNKGVNYEKERNYEQAVFLATI